MTKPNIFTEIGWRVVPIAASIVLGLHLSANAVESAADRCERASSVDAAIEACSSVIQTDNDRHRVAMAYFNRAVGI